MDGSTWLMLGTAAGASVALLFAPVSVRALRATVQAKSYVDLQRLYAEWQARMAESPRSIRPEEGSAVASSALETERYG